MPYSSISDAKEGNFPTKLDGVDLTLGQINHLSKIYDDIKAEGEVDEPMAVAISTFKKAYQKDEGGWVRKEAAMNEDLMQEVMKEAMKDFEEDKLYRINQKEIFKAGTWTDSKGNEWTFDENDIEEIVNAFNKGVRSRDGIPLRFDSHSNDYDPAVGWVEKVWKKGKSLYASFKKIPKMVKKLIENGQYKRVSAGILGGYKDPVLGEKFSNVLDHVALLGAKAPGVKGLDDWGQFYNENGKVFMFSEGNEGLEQEFEQEEYKCECVECGHITMSNKHCKDIQCSECGGEMRRFSRPGSGKYEENKEEDLEKSNKEDKVMSEKLKQLNEKLENEIASLSEKKSELEKKFSELEEKNKQLKEELENKEMENKEKEVKSFLESEEVSKRITPGQVKTFEEVLMNAEDFEAKKEEILDYPVVMEYGEKTEKGEEKQEQEDSDKVELSEKIRMNEGRNVELEGYELVKKAEEAVENGDFETKEEALIALS